MAIVRKSDFKMVVATATGLAVLGGVGFTLSQKAEAKGETLVSVSLKGSGNNVWIVRDDETGCHYMTNVKQGGITPRLKPDGSIYCD